MGKGHRDNFKARKKRGTAAFDLKSKRRAQGRFAKCDQCGGKVRKTVVTMGVCPVCAKNLGIK